MQNPGTDRPTTPNNAYCPSVPISVYRELSAELQAAQAMLEVLNNQNQQLLQQNQQFRQEIDKVVQSTQNLQQMAAGLSPTSGVPSLGASNLPRMNPSSPAVSRVAGLPEVNAPRQSLGLPIMPSISQREGYANAPEDLIIEQEEGRNRRLSTAKTSDVNGWMLLLAILLIIVTAFGTSFLIIRPLFSGNNNNSR
ncbi:MAG: hypothetical protein HC916_17940 [Coleofasciculaceae cyanobacterium SM2_1_6]|nr:hypothetical protein [Coleofasciculaceae cyanobacterium SM2_1_6]